MSVRCNPFTTFHKISEAQPLLSELEEDGVRIALTIVDTPGFGDNIDNEFAHVSRI